MTMDPKSTKGGIHWALIGAAAALVALTFGHYFPSVIPVRASNQKL